MTYCSKCIIASIIDYIHTSMYVYIELVEICNVSKCVCSLSLTSQAKPDDCHATVRQTADRMASNAGGGRAE